LTRRLLGGVEHLSVLLAQNPLFNARSALGLLGEKRFESVGDPLLATPGKLGRFGHESLKPACRSASAG
jgi:hypothetical protein